MAKGKKKHSYKKPAIPILPALPVAGAAYGAYKSNGNKMDKGMIVELSKNFIGLDPVAGTFNFAECAPFWIGEAAALVGHKVASNPRFGIGKAVSRMTMGIFTL
jgi:hypothetical protein